MQPQSAPYALSQPPPENYIPYTPLPTYGHDLLLGIDASLRYAAVVCTQPEPWEIVQGAFDVSTTVVHLVTNVEHEDVRVRCEAWRAARDAGTLAVSAVFGIGGGTAMDFAKYASGILQVPLLLCPSILSVDAGYTVAAGVRELRINTAGTSEISVVYVGNARPAELLIDFKLLQAAPPKLNRSGIGDLLSCATALWDWNAAKERLNERFDEQIAARTRTLLERLLAPAAALAIRDVNEEGLRLLSELYVEEVTLCEQWGNSRCEEGSEHYVAYSLEALTGKSYLHGQLVALCVLLVSTYQGQDTSAIVDFVRTVGLDCSLNAVGTNRQELHHVLTTMGDFVASQPQLLPGVFHFRGNMSSEEATALLDAADAAFVPLECEACEPEPCDEGNWLSWFNCTHCRARRVRQPPAPPAALPA